MHQKKKVNLGFEFQAKKFPRYKDVKSLWRFDYEIEEKKRSSKKRKEHNIKEKIRKSTNIAGLNNSINAQRIKQKRKEKNREERTVKEKSRNKHTQT